MVFRKRPLKTQYLLPFLAGIILTVLFLRLTDCGSRTFTVIQKQVDSSLYLVGKEEGKQEILQSQKQAKDSTLSKLAEDIKPLRKRYSPELKPLDTTGTDSLAIIRALVNNNIECRNVVLLADTLIRSYEMQLIVAHSRMKISDELEVSLLTERAELKNVIRFKDAQLEELLNISWWEKHKFELGFLTGAVVVTAGFISLN